VTAAQSSNATDAWLPLLAEREAGAPVAWRGGRPVSAAQYLADVAACAATLPATGPVANLCHDRYAFAVALGAALQRGQLSLLPPNARVDTLAPLLAEHPSLYGVTEHPDLATPGLPLHRLPPLRAEAAPEADPAMPRVPAAAPAACLLTSGSTGVPQPHHKGWGQALLNTRAGARRLAEHLGLASLAGLTLVATVPPQHSYGFESSVLLALLGGAAFEAGRPFYPADIAAALAAVPRPRALVTTPFHLKALLDAGLDLPPVDLVLSATAPLSPQLARRSEAAMGGPLIEIYGCTEAGQVATRHTAATEQWRTFDGLAISAGAAAPDGSETFLVDGGHVLTPTPLADILQLEDHTPAGATRFRLLGRANDLIHVAGKRSSLGHLNHHLNSIPGVDDGAFWLPDDVADGVVRPVAFVVAPGVPAEQLRAALRQRLEPVFVPRRIVQVAALPREATGKLSAGALRQLALATLGGAAVDGGDGGDGGNGGNGGGARGGGA